MKIDYFELVRRDMASTALECELIDLLKGARQTIAEQAAEIERLKRMTKKGLRDMPEKWVAENPICFNVETHGRRQAVYVLANGSLLCSECAGVDDD